MAEQLKVIIDADVSKAVAGIQTLSKVIAVDFSKAAQTASSTAQSLTKSIDLLKDQFQSIGKINIDSSDLNKIQAKLDSIKVKPLTLDFELAGQNEVDTALQSIRTKFESLKFNPDLSVFNEIVAEINKLKSNEILLHVDNSEALSTIKQIQSSLNSIKGDILITGNVDQAIAGIKEKIAALRTIDLKADPSQAILAIDKIISEITKIKDTDVLLRADNSAALKSINQLESQLKDIRANVVINTTGFEAAKKNVLDIDKAFGAATTRIDSLIDKMVADALGGASEIRAGFQNILPKGTTALKIDLDATAALQKIAVLEKELADLETLSIQPNISSTQFILFQKNIDQVKAKINELRGVGTFVFKADNSQAIAAIEQFKKSIGTLQAGKSIKVNLDATAALNEIKKLETELKDLEALKISPNVSSTQLAIFEKNIDQLKSKLAGLRGKDVGTFVFKANAQPAIKEITSLQAKIISLDRTFKSTSGFNAFQSALGKSTASITALQSKASGLNSFYNNLSTATKNAAGGFVELGKKSEAAGAATTGAFSKAFAGLRTFANIIPGLGISTLFGVIISAVTALGEALIKTSNKAKILRDATSDAIGASTGDIFKINAAVAVIKDLSSSIDAQKNAREFLNKQTGISIDLLSKEKIGSDETTAAIKKATEAIFQRALAEAFASKSAAKQVELFEKQQKLNAALAALPTSAVDFLKIGVNIGNTATAAGVLASQIEKIKVEIEEIKKFGQDAFAKAFDVPPPVKTGKAFKDVTDDILARARQFVKEFGAVFVVPDLEETFFKGKKELLPIAKKLLDNVAKGNLKIKIPVQTDFEFFTLDQPLSKEQLDNLTKNFFKGLALERDVPVDINIDPTLSVSQLKLRDEKLRLQKLFEDTFGNLGVKAFGKIDFENLTEGIAAATKQFANMKLVLDTLTASVSEGLANAFNSVFDAILEGKNVFKALGEAVKSLVVDTIKAIAKMFILRAVTAALGGGGVVSGLGGLIGGFGRVGGQANFGLGGAIGSRSFQNTLQVVVTGQISGSTINLAGQRAAISNQRGG